MKIKYPIETTCFVLLLVVFNLPVFDDPWALYLFPSALKMVEPWRWLTFVWHHVSAYHLLMDGAAFLVLYQSLRSRFALRIQHLAFCIVFSGLIPALLDARLWDVGLCGLSGVAHGLMLIGAFEAAEQSDRDSKLLGAAMFVGVLGKTMFEQVTGNVLFAEHHLGSVGIPIAACHTGGLIGALASYGVSLIFNSDASSSRVTSCQCST